MSNVIPNPIPNSILYDRFSEVLRRLPVADQARVRAEIKVTVMTDGQYQEVVGSCKHAAQFIQERLTGQYRILLNCSLAHYPPAVCAYTLAHELSHLFAGLDEEQADAQVIAWGFEGEMRQARAWGRLMSLTVPGIEYQGTAVMEAL